MDRRDGIILIFLSVILLSPLFIPAPSSGVPLDDDVDMAEKAPENCIPSPRATQTHSGNSPMMVGEVSIKKPNRSIVRIEFTRASNRTIPDGTIQLRFGAFGKVTKAEGFSKQSDGIYNWDRSADPWIEYRVNETHSGPNEIDLTDQANDSQIVPLPAYGGAVQVAFEPAQNGYLGSRFAYLGEYETRSIQAGCQEITLIIPSNAELVKPPDQILNALNETAYRLPVGRAYGHVRVFGYPGDLGDVAGFVRGTEYGVNAGPEVIIEDQAPLGGPLEFTWRHEYIHTRQSFALTSELEWFREASANYFSYRTALDSGSISPREYDALLAWNHGQNYAKRLANHSDSRVAYVWGPLILSKVDARMQSTTNQTLLGTFRWMNHAETDREGITLNQFQNQTLSETDHTTSPPPEFNLTQAITTTEPPKPAYLRGPQWLPAEVREFWLPVNIRLLRLAYRFTGILWLMIVGVNIAEYLGLTIEK